jgi:hypothetical protein
MLVYVWVFSCISIPVVPRPPMTTIGVSMSSILVVLVMTLIIWTFSVSTVTGVIGTTVFSNDWNSYCERSKETQYCNDHFSHLTPPRSFFVLVAYRIPLFGRYRGHGILSFLCVFGSDRTEGTVPLCRARGSSPSCNRMTSRHRARGCSRSGPIYYCVL